MQILKFKNTLSGCFPIYVQVTLTLKEFIIYKILEPGIPENPDSPLIDVETVSSDDDETSKSVNQQEDDQKMLTLAEQFLAAMPDR